MLLSWPSVLLVLAGASVLAGCNSQVALGSQCPPIGRECLATDRDVSSIPDSDPDPLPPGTLDAGRADAGGMEQEEPEDAGPAEAGPLPDAPQDAAPPERNRFPVVDNGSFEVTSGPSTGSLISDFTGTAIEPWGSCNGGVVVAPDGSFRPVGITIPPFTAGNQEQPTDGDYLLYASVTTGAIAGSELSQTLRQPLAPGESYAFAVDLRSSTGAFDPLTLHVFGSDGSDTCPHDEDLAVSAPVQEANTWTTVCVQFVPRQSPAALILAPRFETGTGGTWFMDNLRPWDADCP